MAQIKIYPSKHDIKLVNESKVNTNLNIPLSYINLDYNEYEIKAIIEKDFLKSSSSSSFHNTPVIPGQELDMDMLLFNSVGEAQDSSKLINRIGEQYLYTPPQSFVPNQFSYVVTAKKNMRNSYRSSKKYNINIGCVEEDTQDLGLRLSKIFSNPAGCKLMPPNISINNNKEDLSCFYSDLSKKDFVFMETWNGFWLSKETEVEAGIATLLENNVNVWVGCDTHYKYRYTNDNLGYITFNSNSTIQDFTVKNPIILSKSTVHSDFYFNLLRPEFSQIDGVNVHHLFNEALSPILIIEHKGKGFEIISNNDVLQDPLRYKDLIYEVMMYVYLISYKKSEKINEWISYNVPNYEVINNQLHVKNKFLSSKKLTEILRLNEGDYRIYNIDIYDNNTQLPVDDVDLVSTIDAISCKGIESDRLIFHMEKLKNAQYIEPEKPTGWVSIYKDGKIYYADQIYYMTESDITNKLYLIEQDKDLVIRLFPFKSTKYGINLQKDLTVKIPYIKTEVNGKDAIINETYALYFDLTTNNIYYCYDEEYDYENLNIVKLAIIKVNQSMDQTYLTDIRQLGGGLREDARDDFNMLDIGHINGRPYRKGNTLVITMPTKYREYEDRILEAVNKYKVGEDYVVIFFEDEEE